MRGKKARAIRNMCKELGHWKKEPEYVVVGKVKKTHHTVGKDGKLELKEVVTEITVNKSRMAYRKAKKMYRNGEYTIG